MAARLTVGAPMRKTLILAVLLLGGAAAQAQTPSRTPVQAPTAAMPVPAPGEAAPPRAYAALAGGWELLTDGGRRKCRLTLRAIDAPGGKVVGFPFNCRRSLPVLAKVAAWSVGPDGLIRLNDARGAVVIAFEEASEPFRLKGRADDVDYQLDSLGRARRFVEAPPRPATPRPAFNPGTAPAFETLPGLYAVLRAGGQEVCRINLGTQPGAQEGRFLASFPTRCRDRGLSVFDAVAWRYSGGRIFLIARRGHEIPLAPDGPGQWRRDQAGTELGLRKVGP